MQLLCPPFRPSLATRGPERCTARRGTTRCTGSTRPTRPTAAPFRPLRPKRPTARHPVAGAMIWGLLRHIRPIIPDLVETSARTEFLSQGKGREGKGREGKGREGKGREGKGREGQRNDTTELSPRTSEGQRGKRRRIPCGLSGKRVPGPAGGPKRSPGMQASHLVSPEQVSAAADAPLYHPYYMLIMMGDETRHHGGRGGSDLAALAREAVVARHQEAPVL